MSSSGGTKRAMGWPVSSSVGGEGGGGTARGATADNASAAAAASSSSPAPSPSASAVASAAGGGASPAAAGGLTMNNKKRCGSRMIPAFHSGRAFDADAAWRTLSQGIRTYLAHGDTRSRSYEELYRLGYNMIIFHRGDVLYSELESVVMQHLSEVARAIEDAGADEALLREVKTQWERFKRSTQLVQNILMYMDITYVKRMKKLSVCELCVALFRRYVVQRRSVNQRLINTLLEFVDRERRGDADAAACWPLLRAACGMLVELGYNADGRRVYTHDFESRLLQRTAAFYAAESAEKLESCSGAEYLRHAESRLHEEISRVHRYLDHATLAPLRGVAEEHLLRRPMQRVLDLPHSGFRAMLAQRSFDELRCACRLYVRIAGGDAALRSRLYDELVQSGEAIIADPRLVDDADAMIRELLVLRESYNAILLRSFRTDAPSPPAITSEDSPAPASDAAAAAAAAAAADAAAAVAIGGDANAPVDKRFESTVNDAFKVFLNKLERAAEYMSLYVDKHLRSQRATAMDDGGGGGGGGGGSGDGGEDEDVNTAWLEPVISLFRCLEQKDYFEGFYKQHLAKRLLSRKSRSDDAETAFILKLKEECGHAFTHKMEFMLRDMRTSVETNAAFHASVRERHAAALARAEMAGAQDEEDAAASVAAAAADVAAAAPLDVAVLSSAAWPVGDALSCKLPDELTYGLKVFQDFYTSRYSGRVLTWQAAMGRAELRASFDSGEHELLVSAFQMSVLLLFNAAEQLALADIAEETGIEAKELERALQSLACGRVRVLLKEPKGRNVLAGDVFRVNPNFASRAFRCRVATISTTKEKQETRSRVEQDRRPQIEAAVVRIMKDRKTLEHSVLLAEVTRQLSSRFTPDIVDIKKRIESLIEREFLARRSDRRYSYLA